MERILGMVAFAYGRPGGAVTHPDLIAHVEAVVLSVRRPDIVSGPPVVIPSPPHPVPVSDGGFLLLGD